MNDPSALALKCEITVPISIDTSGAAANVTRSTVNEPNSNEISQSIESEDKVAAPPAADSNAKESNSLLSSMLNVIGGSSSKSTSIFDIEAS